MYGYGFFNDTAAGQNVKKCVVHKDLTSMSIWANNLQLRGQEVLHGLIREVSLVLAGANPEAKIETVLSHSYDDGSEEGSICFGIEFDEIIAHSEKESEMDDESLKDILDSMTEEQLNAIAYIIGNMSSELEHSEKDPKEPEDQIGRAHV